ncbi:MAG: hypothetical protein U9Q29_00185 [Campylobacterota bacterium]|nr:hypothetical protein [Campylobacterota bacterium]
MKTREFTIKTESPNVGFVEDYLFEDLEVPKEYIESLKIYNDYVNIKLSPSKIYFNDDWYVNLQRVG